MTPIKLQYQGALNTLSRMFECTVDGTRYMVVPREMFNKQDRDGIPIVVDGVPYIIWTVYTTFLRDYEMFRYAAEGPYARFKGPRLITGDVIEITRETLDECFNYCAWYRTDTGAVMAVQYPCNQLDAIAHATERNYSFTPLLPIEIEDPYA